MPESDVTPEQKKQQAIETIESLLPSAERTKLKFVVSVVRGKLLKIQFWSTI